MKNDFFIIPSSVNSDCTITRDEAMGLVASNMDNTRRTVSYWNSKLSCGLSQNDREEVAAEVEEKCLEAIDKYDPEKGSVSGWMNTTIKRQVVNKAREKSRYCKRHELYADQPDCEGRFDDDLRKASLMEDTLCGLELEENRQQSRCNLKRIGRAVASLSERDRQVVHMLMKGLDGKTMALKLSISENAQRKLVHDVRKRLGRKILEFGYDGSYWSDFLSQK